MKPWYESKMLWVNLAITVFGALASLAPQVQALMTPTRFAVFTIAVGIVNVVLRFVTTQAIGSPPA